ncbi:hypothetical protein J6590_001869 [Homalodisca vitripennis]|nr:hypothetical protein J6590_001869 [Homalodisca vitripennis]
MRHKKHLQLYLLRRLVLWMPPPPPPPTPPPPPSPRGLQLADRSLFFDHFNSKTLETASGSKTTNTTSATGVLSETNTSSRGEHLLISLVDFLRPKITRENLSVESLLRYVMTSNR